MRCSLLSLISAIGGLAVCQHVGAAAGSSDVLEEVMVTATWRDQSDIPPWPAVCRSQWLFNMTRGGM